MYISTTAPATSGSRKVKAWAGKRVNGVWETMFNRALFPEKSLSLCLSQSEVTAMGMHFFEDEHKIPTAQVVVACQHLAECDDCFDRVRAEARNLQAWELFKHLDLQDADAVVGFPIMLTVHSDIAMLEQSIPPDKKAKVINYDVHGYDLHDPVDENNEK